MKKFMLLILSLTCAVTIVGCAEKKPDGMPDLNDVTIVLTQEGTPVEGATVTCVPVDASMKQWACGGTTDEKGTLVVMTRGSYKGAPEGEYKVTVSKSLAENMPQSESDPPGEFYRLVDKKYETTTTSDLTMTVVKGKNEFSFDLGPAIKERM